MQIGRPVKAIVLVVVAAFCLSAPAQEVPAQQESDASTDARRRIRTDVEAALADGQMTESEKVEILAGSKYVLTFEEQVAFESALEEIRERQTELDAVAAQNNPILQLESALQEEMEPGEPITWTGLASAGVNRMVTGTPFEQPTLAESRFEKTATGTPFEQPTLADPFKETVTGTAFEQPTLADPDESPFKEEDDENEPPKELIFGEDPDIGDPDIGDSYELLSDKAPFGIQDWIVKDDLRLMASQSWFSSRWFSTVTAFKGPLDLDGSNGNFGFTLGMNTAAPIVPSYGIGLQAGTSAVLSDFQGTSFTGDRIRSQNFTSLGLFQRIPYAERRMTWGFTFDWMFDHYYRTLKMSQWRVKMAYDLNCHHQIGMWACIPSDGDNAVLSRNGQSVNEFFKPVAQGNFFHRHLWESGAMTTTWIGLAGEPGEVIFGASARMPISCRLSLIGGFNYVLPSASGRAGQDEEMWNISCGIEFTPGGADLGGRLGRFGPLLRLADNGIFAIRRY